MIEYVKVWLACPPTNGDILLIALILWAIWGYLKLTDIIIYAVADWIINRKRERLHRK